MSQILVFGNKPEGECEITKALKSLNPHWTIEDDLQGDVSQLECIVLRFHATEANYASLSERCNQLNNFLKEKKIKPNIPVISIVYEDELEKTLSLQHDLKHFTKVYSALNLLKNGLVLYKGESSDSFKQKLQDAQYKAGYTIPKSYSDDDLDISGKNFDISGLVVSFLSAVAGFVLGTTAGGLIGGLVIGGVAASLIGTGVGLVAGPIIGLLIAAAIVAIFLSDRKVPEKREAYLQQEKDLTERNNLWKTFEASFFPADSQSLMAPLYQLNNQDTTHEHEPIYQAKNPVIQEICVTLIPDEETFSNRL